MSSLTKAWSTESGGGDGSEGVDADPVWNDTDRAALRSHLRCLWDAKLRTPFNSAGGSAEVASLMACPRDELRDRTLTMLGGINVVAALVFSGLVDRALSPVDVAAFRATEDAEANPWKVALWDAQNVAVAFVTAFTACLTLFTTYLLMQVAVEPTASGLYRAILRMSQFMSYIQFAMGLVLWVLIFLMMGALALRSSTAAWQVSMAVILVPVTVFTAYFMENLNASFPASGLTWSCVWWPAGLRATLRADAKRSGAARVAEAAALHGAAVAPFVDDEEGRGEQASAPEAVSREAQELEGALGRALPHVSHARREHVAAALLRAGLTLGVL
eukprot:CAMPEP_0183804308 /NCGR_PEP_ID=MMETSP0803_2-20130417/34913_1 /TAXON_ID=195967 /ORGANISM="Crustomastix stigmata, Strain CCMP3273" /LENGTH=330 /DNA_ID=CAMNT_0026049059 /DNA_START=123 /DNA_END=1112 /DNA_ORIENTATION=+